MKNIVWAVKINLHGLLIETHASSAKANFAANVQMIMIIQKKGGQQKKDFVRAVLLNLKN